MTDTIEQLLADNTLLEEIRRDMLRFAKIQLRDDALAEDAVQEALAAILNNASPFSSRASAKTWVFSILKNKIVDHIRQQSRTINASALSDDEATLDNTFEQLFNEHGRWLSETMPRQWGDPEESLNQSQFWLVFDACLNRLPENTARVFMMREFLELHVQEICTELSITASNCNVILHRARLALRGCLDLRWFQSGERPC
jgi:RNA polymerase sigma-70 factor (ECF subfamily)